MRTLLKIAVKKGLQGFGFILSNQSPCVVSSVIEGGPAEVASLKPGDEVLEVNSQNVSRSTHEQVVRLILKAGGECVTLKVRRSCEPTDFPNQYADLADDNNDFHNSIIETVDKVVEDLKSGHLFQSYNVTPRRRPPATKKGARASLGGKYETTEPKESKISERNTDLRFENFPSGHHLYPELTPVKQSDITAGNIYKVVVGYIRTIELPSGSNLPSASLNAISNVAGGLHLTSRKINKRLLMLISSNGISLTNTDRKTIITYPLKMLAFTCSCPDDNQYFGIVTRKCFNEDHKMSKLRNSSRFSNAQAHSCLIFMVDTDLSEHSKHQQLANNFGITCTRNVSSDTCEEFPSVSADILCYLNSLFRERTNTGSFSDSSLDCSTPPIRDKLHLISNEISDGISLIERLRIREELEAQKQAKQEDSESGSSDNFFDTVKHQNIIGKSDSELTREGEIGDQKKQFVVESEKKNYRDNGSDKSEITNDYISTKIPLLSYPSITDRFDEESTSNTKFANQNLAESCKETMKDNERQLCLESLLRDQEGLRSFEDFLKKQHSEENVMFWKACEKFKMLEDPCELRKRAIEIYHTYLAHGAPGLVNVDQQAVKKAEEKLISPDSNMYNLQQQQIFMLMKYDCFPRFLKSEFNRRCFTADTQESPEEDADNKECKKRKTHWYIKKLKGNWKEPVTKEPVEADRKRSLLGLLGKSKGQKSDSKAKGKDSKHDLRLVEVSKASDGSSSDGDMMPLTPSIADVGKTFQLAKSPVEIKEFLGCSSQFCRVVLPNGFSTVLMPEPGKTIRQLLQNYCSRQNLPLSSDDAFVDEKNQPVDMNKESLSFCDNVIYLLRKIQFRFDLPSKRSVAVRETPTKTLHEVIEPIMRKNGYKVDHFVIRLAKSNQLVPLESSIGPLENKHLITVKTHDKEASNLVCKPPVNKGVLKSSKSSMEKMRKTSRDDSSLKMHSGLAIKSSKTQDAFNRFLRRGSLEGGSSFMKRKQAFMKSLVKRSNSTNLIDGKGLDDGNIEGIDKDESIAVVSEIKSTAAEKGHLQTDNLGLADSSLVNSNKQMNQKQAENMLISQMNLGKFRPASEVFSREIDDDDFCDDQTAKQVASDSEVASGRGNERDRLQKRFRHSDIAKDFNAPMAASGSKCPVEIIGDNTASPRRKLSKNMMTWRARKNSCDSANSSTTEEIDSGITKRSKRDDKRHSSPPLLFAQSSPRRPRQRQPKSSEEPEIEIANSPIFPIEVARLKNMKPRPSPIIADNELEILRSLDPGGREDGSFDVIDTPDANVNEAEVDDSFEAAIDRMRSKTEEESSNASKVVAAVENQESESMGSDSEGNSSDFPSQDTVVASNSSDVIVTVTGSVNDETLIMEDKDTGFDLTGLMDMTNTKKNRRGARQKGDKNKQRADQAITFV